MILRQERQADIGLLLEGTYPYVSGGVSSWVHQILRGFPDLTFALCFLGSRPEDYGAMRYELPANVVHLEVHYLHGRLPQPPVLPVRGDGAVLKQVERLHDYFRARDYGLPNPLPALLQAFREGRYTQKDFLYGQRTWDYITAQYREHCSDPSFVDYFWTVRMMHMPLWQLMQVAENFIPVRAFHSVSTGYAGYLGTLLRLSRQRPLLLSEHGIYTKERKIDLFQAQWIRDNRGVLEKDAGEVAYLRRLWTRFFEALGRECYAYAHRIVALYDANRLRQISDGAPPARTQCIPNGIDVARLEKLKAKRLQQTPPVACLIGRVVPIKDIKTFIRAMHGVLAALPEAEAWIAGPDSEDPAYARECRTLADSLGIADRVKFLGLQKIDELLPKVGVVVLSSISEALPLVILEAFAAGLPCVATDVGSCRQLLEGLEAEDRALGSAGEVVGIADPEALAAAVRRLLQDPARWQQAQAAGSARVRRYYTQEGMFAQYRELYEEALALPDYAAVEAEGDVVAAR